MILRHVDISLVPRSGSTSSVTNQQFVEVLCVLRFEEGQVALWLGVLEGGRLSLLLHEEAHRRGVPSQRGGRGRQAPGRRPDRYVT